MLDQEEKGCQNDLTLGRVDLLQLADLEASEQMQKELGEEELETVAGGTIFSYTAGGALVGTAGVVGYDVGTKNTNVDSKNLITLGTAAAIGAASGAVAYIPRTLAKKAVTSIMPLKKR